MRILAGYNMFGTDVFVREEDAETALNLLTPEDDGEQTEGDAETDTEGTEE